MTMCITFCTAPNNLTIFKEIFKADQSHPPDYLHMPHGQEVPIPDHYIYISIRLGDT